MEGIQRASDLPIDLNLDIPAESARKLKEGLVDIALAPVAILPEIENAQIISPFCIGTYDEVKTVKLFSDVELKAIKRIYLDYQSRTSVRLTKTLCKYYWNIQPELVPAYPNFQKDIFGDSAGLVIGDRAIRILGKYKFEYDLGEEWFKWQQTPFVFAVWIANKPIDATWLEKFNAALQHGLTFKKEIIEKYNHLNTPLFKVDEYLNRFIQYDLDVPKQQSLEQFLGFDVDE